MKRFPIIKRLSILSLVACAVALGIFFIPRFAAAGVGDKIAGEIIGLLSSALGAAFGAIIALEASAVQWLLDPSTWGPAFTKNPTILLAWRVLRDFANLGFVLAILVIAIGFILRLQTYGSQKTLIRLIFAAILVNFSLLIAGIFIDAATMTTTFFLQPLQGQAIKSSLVAATGITAIMNVPGFGTADAEMSRALAWSLGKTLMLPLFAIILIAALGALMIMLLIRVAHLWILLILSPLAWFAWIFPQFEKSWKSWWDDFLKWTFFAPIVTFFLAFSIKIISNPAITASDPIVKGTSMLSATFQGSSATPFNESLAAFIARFAIAVALIILSMERAQKMGIGFAKNGMAWVTAATKWPGLTAWRTSLKEGRRLAATSNVGQRLEKQFAGSRVLGGVSDWIRKQRELPKEEMETFRARYGALDNAALQNVATGRARSASARIAASKILAERGQFGNLADDEKKVLLQVANSYDRSHAMDLLSSNPTLAPFYDSNIARTATERIGKPGDTNTQIVMRLVARVAADKVGKISKADLGNPAVVLGMNIEKLKRFIADASEDNINTVRGILGRGTPTMVQLLSTSTGLAAKDIDAWLARIRTNPELAATLLG